VIDCYIKVGYCFFKKVIAWNVIKEENVIDIKDGIMKRSLADVCLQYQGRVAFIKDT
jgi:hypothetical protein